ncbi:IPT/TIG domain-containing protein [Thermosyntropha lipolytica DSM 11003]|uniref:IPT/TIG domain-containing protein n=1 Tax=Thermosyntropha lipolytica DSM 11003 TaxID=1123382 RepID=A0A1M5Q0N2_9FIRM|nr:IPT/TIG domain-containing protein [Thermosyntropha lipolytica]SHH07466.1 IPT/TIG domain-containing protein [Thermosyntropha lipolytica DSM 11003]
MYKKSLRWKSFITLLAFIFTGIIGPAGVAYGFDPDNFTVTEITIGKTFNRDRNLTGTYVLIRGTYLKDAEVGVITDAQGYKPLKNRTVNSETILQFEFAEDIRISSLVIGPGDINVSETAAMPALTGIERKVKVGEEVTLTGTNLDRLKNDADLEVKINNIVINKDRISLLSPTQVKIDMSEGVPGLQTLVFTHSRTEGLVVGGTVRSNPVVNIKYTYQDQFLLVQDLDISDDLEMFPNRGEKGDTVFFRASKLDDYDVFFIKSLDGTDPYTLQNRGQNPTFKANAEGDIDILTVQVPNIPKGEYYVVLTNKVPPGKDPMREVISEWVVKKPGTDIPEIFTVIDASLKPRIYSIQPAEGPDSGSPAVISGQFLGTLNISDLALSEGLSPEVMIGTDGESLVRRWGDTSSVIGNYKNTINITEVTRQITVIIGNKASFREGSSFTRDLDRIPINVPLVTDAATAPVKDVIVEITTVLTDMNNNTYTFKERAVLAKGYKFIPSMVQPEVKSIVPDKIEVIKGTGDKYHLPEDRLIALHGQNFMITRFEKDGEIITRYPVIRLGEIELDKNNEPGLTVYVLNKDGQILDGSKGNEIGTKIIALIPDSKNITSTSLGKTFVEVVNPVRNSENPGLSHRVPDMVEFVEVAPNRKPVIEKVFPDVVTVDGGEEVVIEGSNFAEGVKVFLDGEEVKGIKRQGDGKKITFTAPKGREGETQLQVMNPEGGMATWPFTYVRAYTNPKITDFNPKRGNTGTIVMIKGDNFLKPDPTAGEDAILRLIGTRVFLGNIEVNEYNIDPNTRKIKLENYTPGSGVEPVFSLDDDGRLQLAPYYHAVIYQDQKDQSGRFFALDVTARGEIKLSDGAGTVYTIYAQGGSIKADREGGGLFELKVKDNNKAAFVFEDDNGNIHLDVTAKTLYKVENGRITGCRVKVVDRNTIIFTVPILEADGYYDLTVMNPDTRKDSRKGTNGFYYFTHPQSKPRIVEIIPVEGSVSGGYEVEIRGSDFIDDGQQKTRVYVNGIEVKAEDTRINPHGTVITFKMPPYPGNLREDKGTDRLAVPVVVVNPDGASDSREKGFIYVVPRSYPTITKIVPAKGSAAGGDIVEITGSDFRYFEPYDDINRDQLWSLGEPFHDLNGNGVWDDLLTNRGLAEPQPLDHPIYSYYYTSPILPRVYFGDKPARIVEFDRGYIKVITPPGGVGTADVYLVNNDSGISNKVKFSYEGSNPVINKIVPGEGRKQGRENVELYGAGLAASQIEVWRDNNKYTKQMPLVQFGSISNAGIPREQENSGRIDSGRTTVKLEGGLEVEYRSAGSSASLIFRLTEAGKIYEAAFDGYDDGVKFIDAESFISTADGVTRYPGYELIKVKVEDRRLIVERGYAPEAVLVNANQITLKTPSYYTVGKVPVTIYNPDGAKAQGSFVYKNPDSKPKITNITRDGINPKETSVNGKEIRLLEVNYKGKSLITVLGEDFRENARVLIGDFLTIEPKDIVYTLPGKLAFTMPVVEENRIGKLYKLVVVNEDGGVAASDDMPYGAKPIYIQFTKGETQPGLEKADPVRGPASGGTVVKIEGKDLRGSMEGYEGRKLKVFFGGREASQVIVVDYKTVYAVSPPQEPGKKSIRLENPDGETVELKEGFEYISTPAITAIVSPSDPAEATRIREISAAGGEEIKIKGRGFMPGAKVVLIPVIKKAETGDKADLYRVKDEVKEVAGSRLTSKEIDYYTLAEGIPAGEVKYIDGETLTVKVPKGKLGGKGIIVINPDKGCSDIYEDIIYTLPGISAPLGVTAEVVIDRYNDTDLYIKVNWNKVEKASQYDVYVIEDGKNPQFVGTTDLTSFIYKDIKPRTAYKFVVKAVGDFGSSPYSAESNEVKTGSRVGYVDADGPLAEKTEITRQGDLLEVVVGRKDFSARNLVIDTTRSEWAKVRQIVVSIPAEAVASTAARDIEIKGSDFVIKFNPGVFRTNQVLEARNKADAGIRMTLDLQPAGARPANSLGRMLDLKAQFFQGKEKRDISYLARNMSIVLDYDIKMASSRRFSGISLVRYNPYQDRWEEVGLSRPVTGTLGESINQLGRYTLAGRR